MKNPYLVRGIEDPAMLFADLFSFEGCIGRMEYLGTLFALSILGIPLLLIPVTSHFVATGFSFAEYATPMEPVTPLSWAFFAAFYLLQTVAYWISFAAIVKRLHDLGRSGKWVLVVVGGLVIGIVVDAIGSRLASPLSAHVLKIVAAIVLVPTALLGAWGAFEMAVMPGYAGNRYDKLPANDIRRSVT
jgi:uncharacterized membrane protein YhaH (DUF805 family)